MADNQNNTSDPSQPGTNLPGASDDLLEELRKKTAELAGKVAGNEGDQNRTLHIDEKDPVDIFEELEAKDQKIPKQLDQIKDENGDKSSPAADLVRQKLQKLYEKEPDAATEALEAEQATRRSKHQQFMFDLTTSGKSLADIQTQWHNYYVELPDNEKHVVWREFYQMQHQTSQYAKAQQTKQPSADTPASTPASVPAQLPDHNTPNTSTVGDIKSQLINKVNAGGKLKPVHHFKSLLFGLGLASVVGLIITFTFFNEVFIAPFITPSQSVSATPIIGPSNEEVGDESKIIIPKINLEVPVVFNLGSIEEEDIQDALEDGVVHYATTPNPGEIGNSVIVGHSSNNILNAGRYKFAFVLLKRLQAEDIFYVEHEGVRYTYKVYKKEIVPPTAVEVLDTQERDNTMTLITCDPPGTSINRLVVVAEQIDPDPDKNTESTAPPLSEISGASEDPDSLPSNAPSLWSRLWPF